MRMPQSSDSPTSPPTQAPVDDAPSSAHAPADTGASAPDSQALRGRPMRSFVLRAGRMGPGQSRAMAELGPTFVLPYAPADSHKGCLDSELVFGRRAPLVLEIGFGMGQATAQIAQARPDLDFIGIEVHGPGVGALLSEIGERQISNVRIVRHDAVEVLRHMIAPGSLAGVHVFFPDPWHKKRHHKRRLIQPTTVDLIASRLSPDGWLHCATDWQDYAEQMLQVLGSSPALRNTCEAYAPRPPLRPVTKFEARGLRLGHGVWDLVFTKVQPGDQPPA